MADTNFIDFKAAFWFTFAWMIVGEIDPLPEDYQALLPAVRWIVACGAVVAVGAVW